MQNMSRICFGVFASLTTLQTVQNYIRLGVVHQGRPCFRYRKYEE